VPELKAVSKFVLTVPILVNSAWADDIVTAPQKFSHWITCNGVELAGNRSVDAGMLVREIFVATANHNEAS